MKRKTSKKLPVAVQESDNTLSRVFRPFPFQLEKKRKGTLALKSPPINWSSLTPEETESQKTHCTNILWEMEKEGLISRSDLEPYFYTCLEKSGYTKDDIKVIKSLKEWQIPFNLLKIPFLMSLGLRSKSSASYLIDKVTKLLEEGKKNVVPDITPQAPAKLKRTIQDAMKEQRSGILGELQGFEDEMFDKKHDILRWFQSTNISKAHISHIEEYYRPRLEELSLIGEDDQVTEAYESYSKKQIKIMKEWYTNLMSDLDAYKRVKQNQRKIRAKKPKSPTKLVSKLKYMTYSDDYKIQSEKPESIIGSNTLWLFNTKTRRLCVYIASELDKELTVKGSTILGWDPKLSVGKTLRKPQEQLKEFMGGGKVAMRNFAKAIRGKEALLNGRINKDMIILKVY